MSGIPTELARLLRTAPRITVLTGAGVSAESGVPTFRDALTGLWAKFSPEELATPEAFRRNPALVWEWYAWRRQLVARATPSAGHHALAELERRGAALTLITQNVDGLHQLAGSRRVIELHGNLARTRCFAEDVVVETWVEDGQVPPRCPRCGAGLRPDVVWFGEALPTAALEHAQAAAGTADLFLSVGTSSVVHPAAGLPLVAKRHGARLVEINPHATPLTAFADFVLRGPAGVVLPALVESMSAPE